MRILKAFLLVFMLVLVLPVWAEEYKIGANTVNIFNYLQVRFLTDPSVKDQFSVPRARSDIWGNVNPNLGYFFELDATASPAVIYGWMDLKLDTTTKFTLGRFYYPFGLEYTTPPAKFDLINPSVAFWNLFGYSRDNGIQLSQKFESFKYSLAVMNGADNKLSDDNENKDVLGRLVASPGKNLALGISFHNGTAGASEEKRLRLGADLSLDLNPFGLKAECVRARDAVVSKIGFYFQPSYWVNEAWQGLVRFEYWDPDMALAGDRQIVMTLGLNWFFDKTFKFQLNYEIKSEESNETANNALLAQTQLNF